MQASNEEIKKVNEITKDQLWEKFCQECSEDLKCPIRREPFTEDPVTLKGDGRVYEKKRLKNGLKTMI
ncbi:MAG: hypothetical protein HWD59_10780 [Coxiellaceae bacterium]|nr:MAG: hypothetical protein HWD59_10780 [Coxiellaceae bacterium]